MVGKSSRGAVLVSAFLLVNSGCAILAKKPDTPAARLDGKALARTPPPPGERYYLLLFGSHDMSRRPAYTHTWATLVRAVETPGCSDPALDVHTISWLPTKMDIDTFNFRVEPGTNVELHDTIRNSLRTKQNIAMWGPYEVTYPVSVRFLTQKAFLESGAIGYQCIDGVGEAGRSGTGCDCIHAVSDMDPVYARWRYPLAFYGQPATAHLVRRLMHSPIFIDPPTTHDWLIPRLGLTDYPIRRRTYRGRSVPHEPGDGGDLSVVRPAVLPGVERPSREPAPKTEPALPPPWAGPGSMP
ncbi:MAG: hypothetical protein JWO38_4773 [Gemmataceae bacterium]|nr:hypothetical protein [Gemmataceae bacterium]